jgi:hypothetical protein
MKSIKEIIPLAVFNESRLLVSFSEPTNSLEYECFLIDLEERSISKQELQKMLKFTPYEEIPKEQYRFYRNEIYKKIPNEKIVFMLEQELKA